MSRNRLIRVTPVHGFDLLKAPYFKHCAPEALGLLAQQRNAVGQLAELSGHLGRVLAARDSITWYACFPNFNRI